MLTFQILSSVLLLSASVFAQAAPEHTPCAKGEDKAGQMQRLKQFHHGNGHRGSHRGSQADRANSRKYFESQHRPHHHHGHHHGHHHHGNSTRSPRPRPTATEVLAPGMSILPVEESPVAQPVQSPAPVFAAPPAEDAQLRTSSSATRTTRTRTRTTNTPKPSSTVVVPPVSSPKAPAADSFQAEAIAAHNAERALHGAGPVTWSIKLAAAAQEWTDRCVYEHGGGRSTQSGENIAAGYGSITAAFEGWASEDKDYDPKNPAYSHWTQIVWKATTEIGCGVSKCAQGLQNGPAPFYSCIYNPAGNVYGSGADKNKYFDENVQL